MSHPTDPSRAGTSADRRMTIGTFAQRSRLSLKALRLYDELGLLPPAAVDDSTGYRYYRDDQIERARLIALLRRLDMPLDRISQVVDLRGSEQVEAIDRFWKEVEGAVAVKRRLVAYLERHLEGRGEAMYEVKTRQVPAQRVLTVSRNVKVPYLEPFLMKAMGDLPTALEGTPARTDSHCFAIFHGEVSQDSDGPVEVCLPFEGDLAAPDGMAIRIEPAHQEAFTTITLEQCRYPAILEAYDAVHGFITKEGLEPTGSPREVYFVEHTKVGPNDPFCDVAWPAAPRTAEAAAG
jgi:DNA-binding transcriptional MerR regulator